MTDYVLQVRQIKVIPETGDTSVELPLYLTDTVGEPFLNSDLALDLFTIRTTKSTLPGSGFVTFLEGLAQDVITEKYTLIKEGDAEDGSDELVDLETAGVDLKIKMAVTGPGVPVSTEILAILGDTTVKLSNPVTRIFTADTVNVEISKTGDTTSGDATITGLGSTSDLANGMVVVGAGIPDGSTIISVINSTDVEISQNALATASGVSLTFTPAANSDRLQNVSPAVLTNGFVGMSVTGAGIPANTTIAEVLDSSTAVISNNTTATASGVSVTFSGAVNFTFDPSPWDLDLSDLVRVDNIVKFELL